MAKGEVMTEPLIRMCHTCHWVGTAKDMTKEFKCPKCGEFSNVKVMIFLPAKIMSEAMV